MLVTSSSLREALLPALRAAIDAATSSARWQVDAQASPSVDHALSSGMSLAADLSFTGAVTGILTLSLPRNAATSLLGDDSVDLAERWLALARSVGEHLCAALATLTSVIALETCVLSNAAAQPPPFCAFTLASPAAAGDAIALLVFYEPALTSQAASQPEHGSRPLATASPAPLHRVIDVPLAVTLRFGQRQLTLREVLDLNPGTLLELDRHVEEPVDLMLGERIIARGEVVIIDGNYGMRVTEAVELPRQALGAPRPRTAPSLSNA